MNDIFKFVTKPMNFYGFDVKLGDAIGIENEIPVVCNNIDGFANVQFPIHSLINGKWQGIHKLDYQSKFAAFLLENKKKEIELDFNDSNLVSEYIICPVDRKVYKQQWYYHHKIYGTDFFFYKDESEISSKKYFITREFFVLKPLIEHYLTSNKKIESLLVVKDNEKIIKIMTDMFSDACKTFSDELLITKNDVIAYVSRILFSEILPVAHKINWIGILQEENLDIENIYNTSPPEIIYT